VKKKALAAAFTLIFLFSAVAGIDFVRNACANPGLMPAEPPAGYTINSDGTYVAENLRRYGDTYTLTGDINCTIVIQRDGIALDGAGYTLQGTGASSGIWLQEKSNVVIKNLSIRNFRVGIDFSPDYMSLGTNENCSILANTITNNTYGISLTESSKCYVAENYIADNTYGAGLYGGSGVFRNNRFERNQYDILDQGYGDNDMDASNTIDGKPIYYWVNSHDVTVPSDAGLVVLKNCSGIKVESLSLKGNENGLLLCNTNYSTISGNTLSDNLNGILLRQSFNNVITGNHVASNKNAGIEQFEGGGNRILNNVIAMNGYGITCSYTENNVVSGNQVVANEGLGISAGFDCINWTVTNNYVSENLGDGVFFKAVNYSTVIGNNVTLNKGCGIGFGYGPNGMIKGNFISKNNVGIWISNAFENSIISNTIIENAGWGIRLEGSQQNNVIHHNNFIDNNNEGIQASITELWVYPDLFKRLSPGQTPRPPQLVAGAANAWDDGAEGNYWSDYTARYPDAQKASGSTVGNTPYYINENNKDNHPLLAPQDIFTFELPSTSPPSIQPSQEPNPTPTTSVEHDSFPATMAVASLASVAVVGVGLLIYLRKRNFLSERL
jgi:parallel beta-helix repeat protein